MRRSFLSILFLFFVRAISARTMQDSTQALEKLMFGEKKVQASVSFSGHSHNDYKQNIPFLRAYYANMESIEADIFLQQGKLMIAHTLEEIVAGQTLDSLYLRPAAAMYRKHGGHAFADPKKKLQLVIDIKENWPQVIPVLLRQLQAYGDVFDAHKNPDAVRIVLSGDTPPPAMFAKIHPMLFFDGRPHISYTDEQLKRIAMISDDIKNYTAWNGKGTPFAADKAKLIAVIERAHRQNKPFRFWATHDSPNTWIELRKMGVDLINTDQPEALNSFANSLPLTTYSLNNPAPVYRPSFKSDRSNRKVRNVILLIGDGMGLAQVKAGLSANHGNLNIANIAVVGLSRTEAANSGNTDSGAGGSAIATGKKANNATISVDTSGKPLAKIPDLLAPLGKLSGIISTGDVTDATPAVFYASQPDRSWPEQIARDFLTSHVSILAGGLPGPYRDARKRNGYASELNAKGYEVHYSLGNFLSSVKKRQVLFLPDSSLRPVKNGRGNTLQQMLRKTISLLNQNRKGFFIMAEGAQIDYGGHANDLPYVVTELLDFDKAVGEALRFADEDGETLVVVTADHETGGLSLLDANEKTGYVSGSFSTNDHTNIMVPVFAYGPHSDEFAGVYQNTELFYKITRLLGAEQQER